MSSIHHKDSIHKQLQMSSLNSKQGTERQNSLGKYKVHLWDESLVIPKLSQLRGTALAAAFSELQGEVSSEGRELHSVFTSIHENKLLLQRPEAFSSIREVFSRIQNRLWGTGEFKSSWEVRRDAIFDVFKNQIRARNILHESKDYSNYLIEDITKNIQNASYCYTDKSKEKFLSKAKEGIELLQEQNESSLSDESQVLGFVDELLTVMTHSKDIRIKELGQQMLQSVISKVSEAILVGLERSMETPTNRITEIVSQVFNVFLGTGEMKSSLELRREILFRALKKESLVEESPLKVSGRYANYLAKEIQKNLYSAKNSLTAGGQESYLRKAREGLQLLRSQGKSAFGDLSAIDSLISIFSSMIEEEKQNSMIDIAQDSLKIFIKTVPEDTLRKSGEYSLFLVKEITSSLIKASDQALESVNEETPLLQSNDPFLEAQENINLLLKQGEKSFINEDRTWDMVCLLLEVIQKSQEIPVKTLAEDILLEMLEKVPSLTIIDLKNVLDIDPETSAHFSDAVDFDRRMGEVVIKRQNIGDIHYDKNLRSGALLPKIESHFSILPFEEKKDLFLDMYRIDLNTEDLQNPSLDLLEKGISFNLDQMVRDGTRNSNFIIDGVLIDKNLVEETLDKGGTRDIQINKINNQLARRLQKAKEDPRCQFVFNSSLINIEKILLSLEKKEISKGLVMAMVTCDFIDALDKVVDKMIDTQKDPLKEDLKAFAKARKFYEISAQMHQGIFESRVEMNLLGFDLVQENPQRSPFTVSSDGVVSCEMECSVFSTYLQMKAGLDPKARDTNNRLLVPWMLSSEEKVSMRTFDGLLNYTFDIASLGTYKVSVSRDTKTGKASTEFVLIEENPMFNNFNEDEVVALKDQKMFVLADKKYPQILKELEKGSSPTIDMLLESRRNKIGDRHIVAYLLDDIVEEIDKKEKEKTATATDLKIRKTAKQIKEARGLLMA